MISMILDQEHNNSTYLIYLCHHNKEFEKKIKDLIMSNLKNTNIILFKELSEIPIKPPLADLVIYDVDFLERTRKTNNYKDLKQIIYNHYNNFIVPMLIFVTKETYDKTDFEYLQDREDSVFSFADENYFIDYIFLSRIRSLLSFPKIARKFTEQKLNVQNTLWKALDYSHLFVILINKDFKIVLANYRLAKTLGYEDGESLIGIDWSTHLAASDHELGHHVLQEIINGSSKYEEMTLDILTKEKERIKVSWFHTLVNSTFNCVFSIGVPITKEITVDDNIDTVRAYFTDIIRKDRTTINAMKEVTMKYSEKILGKKIS